MSFVILQSCCNDASCGARISNDCWDYIPSTSGGYPQIKFNGTAAPGPGDKVQVKFRVDPSAGGTTSGGGASGGTGTTHDGGTSRDAGRTDAGSAASGSADGGAH